MNGRSFSAIQSDRQRSADDGWTAIIGEDVNTGETIVVTELPRSVPAAKIELFEDFLVPFDQLESLSVGIGQVDEFGRANLSLEWRAYSAALSSADQLYALGQFQELARISIRCFDDYLQVQSGAAGFDTRCQGQLNHVLNGVVLGGDTSNSQGAIATDYAVRLISETGGLGDSDLTGIYTDFLVQLDYGVEFRDRTDSTQLRLQFHVEGSRSIDDRGVFGGRGALGPHWGLRRGRAFLRVGPELTFSWYGKPQVPSWYLPPAWGYAVRTLFLARLYRHQVVYASLRPGWLVSGIRSEGPIHESHLEAGTNFGLPGYYLGVYQTRSFSGSRAGLRFSIEL